MYDQEARRLLGMLQRPEAVFRTLMIAYAAQGDMAKAAASCRQPRALSR
jgi:hypothetical protein